MAATARELQQFLDSLEPGIARAFRESVAGIRNSTRIGAVEEALRLGNINAAIDQVLEAVAIRPASWSRLTEAVRTAYRDSGQFTMESEIPSRLRIDFNMENPRARDWLAAHSAELVTEINRGQRGAIRAIVTDGFQRGDNPRTTALNIVGRISPQTGRRVGGVIGLHDQFADYAASMRRALLGTDGVGVSGFDSNGNPIKKFWIGNDGRLHSTLTRRDRRFDSLIRRSIESGAPLSNEDINRLVGRYEDRLLQTRGTNIARTEALTSMNKGADEAMDQVIEEGLIDADAITDVWDASMDGVTRPDHAAANGQRRTHGQPFEVGGYLMLRPGDTSLGAPAEQVINCFDGETLLSYDSCKKSIRSTYNGELITIKTSSGYELTGTANHPVMTDAGFVRLDEVKHSTNLLCCALENNLTGSLDANNVPTTFHKLHNTLSVVGVRVGVVGVPVNLYGREPGGDIDVVGPECLLRRDFSAGARNIPSKDILKIANFGERPLLGGSLLYGGASEKASRFFSDALMRITNLVSPLLGIHFRPFQPLCVGPSSNGDARLNKNSPNRRPADAKTLGDRVLRLSRHVHIDNPVSINRRLVHNHPVYTIETEEGIYNAGGIVAQNCRCVKRRDIDFSQVRE